MIDKLLELEKADYCLIACHLGADRAPSFYTLLEILHLHRQPSPMNYKKILGTLFSNAILHQNRPPHSGRIQIFDYVAQVLLERPPL